MDDHKVKPRSFVIIEVNLNELARVKISSMLIDSLEFKSLKEDQQRYAYRNAKDISWNDKICP